MQVNRRLPPSRLLNLYLKFGKIRASYQNQSPEVKKRADPIKNQPSIDKQKVKVTFVRQLSRWHFADHVA